MARKIALKRFTGVYVTESTVKRWRERPDRCYWVAFKDAQGRLRWERCGWASEGWDPIAAQNRRRELLEKDRVGEYKPKKLRQAELLTLSEFMARHYLPWATENKRHGKDDRSLWENWLKPRLADKPMKNVSALDLERLKKDMREAGRAPATIRHALSLVRRAYNKAILWGLYTGQNPCSAVTFPQVDNARKRFLTREEEEMLLTALRERSPQVARMAILSLYGGLRLGEVLGLRWGHVDLKNGIITVRDTKNTESRPVFITTPVRQVLTELTPGRPDDPVFQTRKKAPVQWLSNTFQRVVDRLGLNDGVTDRRDRVCFHTLRHTWASRGVMAGKPIYKVGRAMGHKTLAMTERYSHLAPESYREVFEAVAAWDEVVMSPGIREGG